MAGPDPRDAEQQPDPRAEDDTDHDGGPGTIRSRGRSHPRRQAVDRIGFTMRLLPGAEAEYRRRHAAVWPEMLAALKAAGARDYSIFIRGDDLFAYLEVDDFDAFRRTMGASPVNDRWQADMAGLIDPLTDPATGFHERLEEIFHLD